jgi:hypothetical protein
MAWRCDATIRHEGAVNFLFPHSGSRPARRKGGSCPARPDGRGLEPLVPPAAKGRGRGHEQRLVSEHAVGRVSLPRKLSRRPGALLLRVLLPHLPPRGDRRVQRHRGSLPHQVGPRPSLLRGVHRLVYGCRYFFKWLLMSLRLLCPVDARCENQRSRCLRTWVGASRRIRAGSGARSPARHPPRRIVSIAGAYTSPTLPWSATPSSASTGCPTTSSSAGT